MRTYNLYITFIVLFAFCRCSENERQNEKSLIKLIDEKDTIDVVEIRNDFRERLYLIGKGVDVNFYDKRNHSVDGFYKGDTGYVVINYVSDTFIGLMNTHIIDLKHVRGDFHIIERVKGNKFKFAIGKNADTIEYDVFMTSDKYVFNDYYLDKENDSIKFEIVNRIGLCRLTEIPKVNR